MEHDALQGGTATAEVVVVSMADAVLLMVRGDRTVANHALVDELRSSLVATGTRSTDITVLWPEPALSAGSDR